MLVLFEMFKVTIIRAVARMGSKGAESAYIMDREAQKGAFFTFVEKRESLKSIACQGASRVRIQNQINQLTWALIQERASIMMISVSRDATYDHTLGIFSGQQSGTTQTVINTYIFEFGKSLDYFDPDNYWIYFRHERPETCL